MALVVQTYGGTSEIKVSCVVEAKYAELAVTVLHDAFGLEKQNK
jgi:aspartate kinase